MTTDHQRAQHALAAAVRLLRPSVAEDTDDHSRNIDRPSASDVAWGHALAALGQGFALLAVADKLDTIATEVA